MAQLMERFDRVKTPNNQTAYRVTCDREGCNHHTDIVVTQSSTLPPEFIAKKARQRNWQIDKRGNAVCPTCAHAERLKEKPTKKQKEVFVTKVETITPQPPIVLPPRDPTPTDLRRIMREIDDNWDEAKGMYSGSNTDKSIAAKLNVPFSWVAAERERAFGPSQRNEAIDNLLKEAKRLKQESNTAMQRAIDAAACIETNIGQLDVLIKKLEKIA